MNEISVIGNVKWLVDPTGESKNIPCENCFEYLFSNCSALTHAPELPATQLADFCYSSMFSGCESLTTAPQLPATQLAYSCYSSMFNSCTSLTSLKGDPKKVSRHFKHSELYAKL